MNMFEAAIGWVAPATCAGCGSEGSALCQVCAELEILPYGEHCGICAKVSSGCQSCLACRRKGAPRRILIATDYAGLSKSLLQLYKYRHQRSAAASIAEAMSGSFLKYTDDQSILRQNYLIVPVPTASSRVRARGFDHAELLARHVAKRLGLDCSKVLRRIGQSRQVGAKRIIRLRQQTDNYIVRNLEKTAGRNILLVDDVITTGATLAAARKVLRQAGAKKVEALVFAKRL